jgi:hypothetical protein
MRFNKPIRPCLQLCFVLLLWIIAFLPIFPGMVSTWFNNSDESHGILVPLICIYLIWQKKDLLSYEAPKSTPAPEGIWILFVSMILYIISYAGGVSVLSRLMIVVSMMGLILSIYGRKIDRKSTRLNSSHRLTSRMPSSA